LFVSFSVTVCGQSTDTLRGIVRASDTKSGLAGAKVHVRQRDKGLLPIGAITDNNGSYQIVIKANDVSGKPFDLIVSYPWYVSDTVSNISVTELAQGKMYDIVLHTDDLQHDKIIIPTMRTVCIDSTVAHGKCKKRKYNRKAIQE
jgi:hypothetical protein